MEYEDFAAEQHKTLCRIYDEKKSEIDKATEALANLQQELRQIGSARLSAWREVCRTKHHPNFTTKG